MVTKLVAWAWLTKNKPLIYLGLRGEVALFLMWLATHIFLQRLFLS
jgi:hypothetical protein